ncbi:MAG: S-formylglutathione hydrolase [Pseudomonadota bacterium]
MANLEILSENRTFGGQTRFMQHRSSSTACDMTFAVYEPPQAQKQRVPILYWLSGLTCNAENFTIKAGAQRFASQHGLMLVVPDTSPRNTGIEGEDDADELGSGAGFYVNATTDKWRTHYQMYDYVTQELPDLIKAQFNVDGERESVFGHSMGGHGALVCALRNPGRYRSVSAFAPVCAPTEIGLGQQAFLAYLGEDRDAWASYDTHLLLEHATERLPILVDQGADDEFISALLPQKLAEACETYGHDLTLRMQPGYDHSYYFISTFMEEHMAYHADALTV